MARLESVQQEKGCLVGRKGGPWVQSKVPGKGKEERRKEGKEVGKERGKEGEREGREDLKKTIKALEWDPRMIQKN